ncbi:MAG: type II toxin-antitoxin system VapC family toxin [Acidimicrobiia bacterium]|nr:type II toxin-antitoxin system VapC family toxin [Acidimicrobiia bacterium]
MPEHYFVEVASVIRRAEVTDALTAAEAAAAIGGLDRAPLRRVQIRPLLQAAWRLRGHITVYDALYVVLADHLHATLVTSDLCLAGAPNLPVATITPSVA